MSKVTKKVLVMMSTYNGEKYLKEQIDSIINQQTDHIVHLRIRDDGSKDCTCNIVKEYIEKYPDTIELIEAKNIGCNASFFSLIQGAEGYDYYSISDQDDVWLKDKLQTACDAIDTIGERVPVLYASPSYLVHEDLIPYGTTRKKERELSLYNTIVQNICPGHTQVMNNQLLNLLKEKLDYQRVYVYDSWIANIANLYGEIIYDNEPHTYYRQYEGNQLGSGVGVFGQLSASIKRVGTNDGIKYRRQIEYFLEYNYERLSQAGYLQEIINFGSAKSFFARLKYSITGKIYRQKRLETIALYFAIIMGKF